MQFPWMMYCKGPGLALPHGQSVSCKAAADETDYAEAIKAGWFPSVPEALDEKLDAPVKPVAPVTPAVKSEARETSGPVSKAKDDGGRVQPREVR